MTWEMIEADHCRIIKAAREEVVQISNQILFNSNSLSVRSKILSRNIPPIHLPKSQRHRNDDQQGQH